MAQPQLCSYSRGPTLVLLQLIHLTILNPSFVSSFWDKSIDQSPKLIYQQPNPSVHYEYSVPSADTEPHEASNAVTSGGTTTRSPHSGDTANQSDISNNKINENSLLPKATTTPAVTTKPQPVYEWVQSGHSECSATCGTVHSGVWQRESYPDNCLPYGLCDRSSTRQL
uniref:Uncharacterized protein n=1 Tax=Knipowitschia caucasica TaxID=637954 RepID=A0AAV2LLP6_KNICA